MNLKKELVVVSMRCGWFVAVLVAFLAPVCVQAGNVWIDIDTSERKLYVMNGQELVRTFDNISIGSNGVSESRQVGDKTTPLGKYQVSRFNHESRFHLFIGVDYPNREQAYAAYMADKITAQELEQIYQAHQRGLEPPANTYLGGAIGIHGIGNGDLAIHQDFNWTDGCVAMTDEEVDEVAQWVKIGTVVVIR